MCLWPYSIIRALASFTRCDTNLCTYACSSSRTQLSRPFLMTRITRMSKKQGSQVSMLVNVTRSPQGCHRVSCQSLLCKLLVSTAAGLTAPGQAVTWSARARVSTVLTTALADQTAACHGTVSTASVLNGSWRTGCLGHSAHPGCNLQAMLRPAMVQAVQLQCLTAASTLWTSLAGRKGHVYGTRIL